MSNILITYLINLIINKVSSIIITNNANDYQYKKNYRKKNTKKIKLKAVEKKSFKHKRRIKIGQNYQYKHKIF